MRTCERHPLNCARQKGPCTILIRAPEVFEGTSTFEVRCWTSGFMGLMEPEAVVNFRL